MAQNYSQTVGCHDDQPKKFLPGKVSFLAHQNNGKKEIYPLTCVIFYFVNLMVILQRDKNESSCVTGLHDSRVKCLAGQVTVKADIVR